MQKTQIARTRHKYTIITKYRNFTVELDIG